MRYFGNDWNRAKIESAIFQDTSYNVWVTARDLGPAVCLDKQLEPIIASRYGTYQRPSCLITSVCGMICAFAVCHLPRSGFFISLPSDGAIERLPSTSKGDGNVPASLLSPVTVRTLYVTFVPRPISAWAYLLARLELTSTLSHG